MSVPATMPRRLVFWTRFLSHHQASWIQHLVDDHGFVVEHGLDLSVDQSARVAQGWPSIKTDMPIHVAPDATQVNQLVTDRMDDSLHIITGGFSFPTPRLALKACLSTGAPIAIMAEEPSPFGKYYGLKKIAQMFFARAKGARVKGIWAIGKMCVDFYHGVGYPTDKVAEWAYFPPVPLILPSRSPHDKPQVLYVGQFMERKGVDILLDALQMISSENFHMDLVGGGVFDQLVKEKVATLKDVSVHNFKPYQEAMATVAQADLVVVPSRYDGYGAVVSEALGYGIPVVCTDQCGSQIMLRDPSHGAVAKAGNATSLAEALRSQLKFGPLTEDRRHTIHQWSLECISPPVAAAHFVKSLEALYQHKSQPESPWAKKAS